uniref:Protein unc 80 n=1 Tax=Echinococcus granulosus TaxID=6210 RepID=A0A068WCS3_ECHGR|nr:protein unc 80 [Echinococcus granulosus]
MIGCSSFVQSKRTRDNVCLNFERVLVQNILYGLPPTTMIRQRLKSSPSTDAKGRGKTQLVTCTQRPPLRFDQAETKLLYTLQWLLLDAASECADNDPNFKVNAQRERAYLHDLASLQLFIYLFAPVLERLKCEDFDTLKLESGLRLWAPLILHRQPYEGSFPVPVKTPSGQFDEEVNVNPLRSYVDQFGPLPTVFQRPGEGLIEEDELGGLEAVSGVSRQVPHSITPFYPTSPNLKIPNAESSDEDSACYNRHSVSISASALKQSHNRPVVPMARLNDICPVSLKDTDSEESKSNRSESFTIGRSYLEQTLEEQIESLTQTVLKEAMATDTVLASHCDLAVMRCLFSPEWSEAGAVWALRYLERRLMLLRHERRRERAEARAHSRFQRLRATLPEAFFAAADAVTGQAADLRVLRSLSMPQLAPPHHYPSFETSTITATPASQPHITGSASIATAATDITDEGDNGERHSADGRRKIFVVDGTGGDEKQSTSMSQNTSSFDQQSSNTESQPVSIVPASQLREPTTLPTLHHFSSDPPTSQARFVTSDAIVTSSPDLDEPTLSKPLSDESIPEDHSGFLTVPSTDTKQMDTASGSILRRSNRTPLSPKSVADLIDLRDGRPLFSKTKSQISLNEARFFGSDVTVNLDEVTDSQNSIDAGSVNFDLGFGFLLHRCHSDTNITYNSVQQIDEVTGSNHYIKRDGQINCATLLRGLYWVCNLQSSIRVGEHLLKNVYCLIDLCALTWKKPKSKKQSKPRQCYRQSHEDSTHSSVTRVGRRTYGRHGPHARSKSVAILGLQPGLNYTSGYGGRASHVPSRGSSIITHDDIGSVEKLVKVNSSGRLTPFGRIRNRRQIPVDDGGERSAEMSSDEENSATRSVRVQQMHSNFRKSDKYLNVDSTASTQVRFQSRKQIPTRQSNNYSFRRGGEIPACEPTRLLPNRLRIVDKRPQRKVRTGENTTLQEKTPAMLAEEQQQATINFGLIMEILVKIIRVLGCSHGHPNVCGSGGGGGLRSTTSGLGYPDNQAGAVTAMLRRHAHECLLRMFHANKSLFYCFFSRLIAAVPITELMEFLHGLTSFCLDPVVLNPTRSGSSEKWSYHNSFGQSFTGEGTRGAEGVIISSLMGTLVRRFVRCRRELATQENISLFTEVRHLLTYLKSVHGNTFRRALLCALLCPMRTVLMRNKPSAPLPRPRMLSARNSLWPTFAPKRPSMIIPPTDFIDVGDCSSALQNKRSHGQNLKSVETKFCKPVIERRLVDLPALKENLRDFAFLLECLEPGTLPEPQLVASFLDLNAPVLARACLLLECAFFVHRCNRGEWPAWMKINLPLPIQQAEHLTQSTTSSQRIAISISGPASAGADSIDLHSSAFCTTSQIQWSAGRLFHSWAEALGIRIMAFLEGNSSAEIYLNRDFQSDENFLDDATVNPNGDSCPYALLVMAVQLLNEITTFLRESHQHATRAQVAASSSASSSAAVRTVEHSSQWDGSSGANGRRNLAGASNAPPLGALKSTRRRLSILMPIFAQSEVKDKHNPVYIELSNVRGEDDDTNSRFTEEYARKPVSKSLTRKRQRSGSFRQSFQLSSLMGNPRSAKTEGGLRRMSSRASTSGGEGVAGDSSLDDGTSGAYGSHASRHALPPSSSTSASLRPEAPSAANAWGRRSESGEALVCPENNAELEFSKRSPRRDRRRTSLGAVRDPSRSSSSRAQNQTHVADFYSSNMPWIPAVIAFAKRTTFGCKHQPKCEANCFDRQQQQLRSLLQAIRQVYSATTESSFIRSVDDLPEGRRVRGTVSDTISTSDARSGNGGGSTSCQCIPDPFSGAGGAGNEEEESGYSDEVNDSDQEITGTGGLEDLLRLALNPAPLLRGAGPASMSAFGVGGGDPELETSASILHRVFGGRDHQDKRNTFFTRNAKRKESSAFTSGWREATTPIFDRFRRKGTPKRGSGAFISDDGGTGGFCGPGGLSSLMNLSLLAGAGTGLAAANSSPSLVRLLEAVKSGLASGTMLSVEGDDGQSEAAEFGKTKVRPLAHQTDSPELMYLDTQVQSLRSSFFNLLNKGALLLSSEQLEEVVPLAWELLLEADPELISSAASLILFAAVKCSAFVQKLLYTELQHAELNNRLNAVLRFRALWTARQQVWSRLEEGASQCLKVPPPLIEYVLPSPTLGNPSIQVPDPAWETRKGTLAEEVQLKQNEATKTFVTASTSRRKQQQELLARAVTAAKLARDEARSLFHITTSSILELAATEAVFSKDHRGDEAGGGEDGNIGMANSVVQEEFNLAARKVSFAPMNRSLNLQARSFSWRNGSFPLFRDNVTLADDDEAGISNTSMLLTHQLKMAQTFFPSCICAATLPLTNLMDDCAVNNEGIAVSTVAETVIWQCLLEDTSLFLRYIFEKLTRVPHKDDLISVIRKLVQRLPELPMQTAHILFNNLVGCIMFHVRTPSFDAPDSIASILCVLHMIIPYVKNIYFKDLKQTFRREQIDSTLLVTANLPCAKQFNVFCDTICVAQLVKLQDDNKDYRFNDILTEALEGNGMPHSEYHLHVLCDDRSNIIRNSNHYVRDFYPFKRNHIPKLKLMRVDRETGQQLLQRNAFSLKVQEVGKLLLVKTILQTTAASHMSNHILFLREELAKLPSFPRKALEAEFTLYECGDMGKALFAMDSMHKLTWCQLINSMFQKMTSTFPWSTDLQLFLNVYNGTLVLHAEDTTILRQCLAFYLQCCYQFKMIFSVNGYLSILPTIIRVYHNNQHNGILKQAIEFIFRQFYIMHRTPFILQMFGSIANYIDLSPDDAIQSNFYRIQPETLYQLLRAIGREIPDTLGILQLCSFSKPLKALVILQAMFPYILRDLPIICGEECTGADSRKFELQVIQQLSVMVKQLICTTEWMTRRSDDTKSVVSSTVSSSSIPGGPRGLGGDSVKRLATSDQPAKMPEWASAISGNYSHYHHHQHHSLMQQHLQRSLTRSGSPSTGAVGSRDRRPPSSESSNKRSAHRQLYSGDSFKGASGALKRSASAVMGASGGGGGSGSGGGGGDSGHHIGTPAGWRKSSIEPREAILQIASEFLTVAHRRLGELGERQKSSELLDGKAFMRLSELAQSIVKQFPHNVNLLKSRPLQRFFLEILPLADWSHESLRGCKALETLVGRLNRTLPKLLETASFRRQISWEHLTNLIRALYRTVQRNRAVAHLKEIKLFNDYLKRSLVVGPNAWWSSERLFTTTPQATITMVTAQHLGRRATMGTTTAGGERSVTYTPGVTFHPELITSTAERRAPPRVSRSPTSTGSTLTSSLAKGTASSTSSGERVSTTTATGGAVETSCLPTGFASEATRFIALMLSCLESSYRLKDLCERANFEFCRCPTIFEGGTENLSNYLAYLIVPLLLHCSTGRGDYPSLSKENVYYALEVCLSGLFVGSEKCTSTGGVASTAGTETVGVGSSRPSGAASDHMAFEGPRKLGIHSSFMLTNSKSNQPMGAMGEGCGPGGGSGSGGGGGIKSSLGQSMSGTVGVTGLLQLPNLLGGPPVTGSTWELIRPSGLACDLGGGRVHGCVVNLVGPTLHSMRHPKAEEIPGASAVGAMTAATSTAFPGNSVKVSHANPSILSNHEKNVQSQIDVVHKLAFLGLKLILIVYPRHALAKSRHIIAILAKLAFYQCCGVQLWKFLDFVVTYRPSIFMHMAPFFRFQVLNFKCETQGEQAFQQIIGQKLIGLHLPPQQTIVSLLKELLLDLQILREEKQMLNLMRQKHQLFLSPRQMPDSSMLAPSAASDSGNSVASAPLPGILRHSSEKHFCILEGGQARPFSQIEFRQSLLRRTSGKRIAAHDGSRFLSHHRTLSQRKPILTASVESLPRQSGPPGGLDKRHRSNGKTRGELRRAMTNAEGGEKRSERYLFGLANNTPSPQDDGTEDINDGVGMDELNAPANPLIAAAVATSLYGSAAPYTHVREKAREELPDLIGVADPLEPYKQSRPQLRSSKPTDNIPLVDLHALSSTSIPPLTPLSPPHLQDPAVISTFDSQLPAAPQMTWSHVDTPTKIHYV